jgi:hypothetical protein
MAEAKQKKQIRALIDLTLILPHPNVAPKDAALAA